MAPRQSWFGVQPNLDRILASLTGPPDAAAKQRAEEARLRADAARHGVSEQSRRPPEAKQTANTSLAGGGRAPPSAPPKKRGTLAPKVETLVERLKDGIREGGDWLDNSPIAKAAGAEMARNVGAVTGVVRGGIHSVDGAKFIDRLGDPSDWLFSPPGQSAHEQLYAVGKAGAQYLKERIQDPSKFVADVKNNARQMRVDLDPTATPVAPTFAGELRRTFDIGQNQGELAFDIGTSAIGGPLAKGVKEVGLLSKAASYEKSIDQGFSPELAAYLAEPYPVSAMGHHFVPRRTKLPKFLGGGPISPTYSNSVFNRLAPKGITRGEMYDRHFRVDPHFGGARIPAKFAANGERWSGKQLGLKKYRLPGRIWHGAPAPLKARVGGLGATLGSMLHSEPDEGR